MGDVKRRAKFARHHNPSTRGLIISQQIAVGGNALGIISSEFHPQDIRFWLLFWDKMVCPLVEGLAFGTGETGQFLEEIGLLERPYYNFGGGFGDRVVRAHMAAYDDLDKKEPGAWSIAEGTNSFIIPTARLRDRGGISVELNRAIPIPDKEVAIYDILEFKAKRKDELLNLRVHLDGIARAIDDSDDQQGELSRQVKLIDGACSDLIRLNQEWRMPFRLSGIKMSLDLRPTATLGSFFAGLGAGNQYYGMPMVASLGLATLSAVGASIKFSGDFGLNRTSPTLLPYKYMAIYCTELFY